MARSADIVKEARSRAGMTQAQLARAAGVTQSVISAYETGHREPGWSTLERLVVASGHELLAEVAPLRPSGPAAAVPDPAPAAAPDRAERALASTELGRRLLDHRDAVLERARARGARDVRVFGSVARGESGPGSDVDLLVDLAPGTGLFAMLAFQREVSELLGVAVEVVPSDALRDRYRAAVLSDALGRVSGIFVGRERWCPRSPATT